jgi:hypothetical protein
MFPNEGGLKHLVRYTKISGLAKKDGYKAESEKESYVQ